MKKALVLSFIYCLTLASCSEQSAVEKKIVLKEKIELKEVKASQFLSLEMKGMVCKMGCGSSIKKALMETKAIASCEIDFKSDRSTNFVKIAFDKQLISKEKIIQILEAINKKQFSVIKSEDSFEKSNSLGEKKQKNQTIDQTIEEDTKLDETNYDTPNLIDIYTRLVTS